MGVGNNSRKALGWVIVRRGFQDGHDPKPTTETPRHEGGHSDHGGGSDGPQGNSRVCDSAGAGEAPRPSMNRRVAADFSCGFHKESLSSTGCSQSLHVLCLSASSRSGKFSSSSASSSEPVYCIVRGFTGKPEILSRVNPRVACRKRVGALSVPGVAASCKGSPLRGGLSRESDDACRSRTCRPCDGDSRSERNGRGRHTGRAARPRWQTGPAEQLTLCAARVAGPGRIIFWAGDAGSEKSQNLALQQSTEVLRFAQDDKLKLCRDLVGQTVQRFGAGGCTRSGMRATVAGSGALNFNCSARKATRSRRASALRACLAS